jgi:hypothetical protein
MWDIRERLFPFVHQARFANARLPTYQYHLSQTLLYLTPAVVQQRQRCLATHKGREPGDRPHFQTVL